MAILTTERVNVLALNDHELELIHNLIYSGPRLGHGYYSDLVSDLDDVLDAVRGPIAYEDRLFDYGDVDGHRWVRTEPQE